MFGGGESGGFDDDVIIEASSDGDSRKSSRSRRSSEDNEKCEDVGGCDDTCTNIYNSDGKDENQGRVDRCLELRYATVNELEVILELLEEPYYSSLKNIKNKDFEDFLEVSVGPWVKSTKAFDRKESEDVLRWIATESGIAKAIVDAYKEYEDFNTYEGVYNMIKDVGNSKKKACDRVCNGIVTAKVGGGKSFWSILKAVSNSSAEDIACEVMKNNCPGDKNDNCNSKMDCS